MENLDFFETHGYKTVCNLGGYQIQISKCGTCARFVFFDSEPTEWIEIELDEDDNPYCETERGREYISDYMRVIK